MYVGGKENGWGHTTFAVRTHGGSFGFGGLGHSKAASAWEDARNRGGGGV